MLDSPLFLSLKEGGRDFSAQTLCISFQKDHGIDDAIEHSDSKGHKVVGGAWPFYCAIGRNEGQILLVSSFEVHNGLFSRSDSIENFPDKGQNVYFSLKQTK